MRELEKRQQGLMMNLSYCIETNIKPGKIGINRDTDAMINYFHTGNFKLVDRFLRKRYIGEISDKFLGRKQSDKIAFVYFPQILITSSRNKKIIRVHDLFPISNPEWFRKRATVYFRMAMKNVSRAYFLCDSYYTEKQLHKFYPETIGKSAVLYCNLEPFLNTHSACGDCQACCAESQVTSPFALAIGTVEPRKNYKFLLEAWSHILSIYPQKKLVIVGSYGWKNKKIRKQLLNPRAMNVLWYQDICDYSLKKLYTNCEVFISASHQEGFNYPAAEARHLSIPSLLSYNEVNVELHSEYATFFRTNVIESFVQGYFQALKSVTKKQTSGWKPPMLFKADEIQEILKKL
jgi:glycosyltransferase involved in cell wall biosynthesis